MDKVESEGNTQKCHGRMGTDTREALWKHREEYRRLWHDFITCKQSLLTVFLAMVLHPSIHLLFRHN